jgi:hypothetical protein
MHTLNHFPRCHQCEMKSNKETAHDAATDAEKIEVEKVAKA